MTNYETVNTIYRNTGFNPENAKLGEIWYKVLDMHYNTNRNERYMKVSYDVPTLTPKKRINASELLFYINELGYQVEFVSENEDLSDNEG